MPHLTAAHARMQGGKNSARAPPPTPVHMDGQTSRPSGGAGTNFGAAWRRRSCSKIDISDRVCEVSLLTLLNAQ